MNILFIADPLATFKTYKDTTYAMMREAAKRGHKLHHTLAGELSVQNGKVVASRAVPIHRRKRRPRPQLVQTARQSAGCFERF